MKKLLLSLFISGSCFVQAQGDINSIFAAGLDDAETFMSSYLSPFSESVVYSIGIGWYNTAKAKPLGGFEISVIGNVTGFKNKQDKKTFLLDPNDYANLDFVENSGEARLVSTALGDISGVEVFVQGTGAASAARTEFELPAGLSAEGLDFTPSGYIQASVGIFKGTEIKARFLPKMEYEGSTIGLIGVGLQHDFTSLLPADKIIPVAISAVVGYTNISGDFNLTEISQIQGDNQKIETRINSLVVSGVVSTKLPIINFYGGVGYVSGTTTTDVLGTYRVVRGPFASETYTDPFAISKKVAGVTGTIGTKLKLGFFRLNAEYNLGVFNTATVGVNFGFR